MQHSSAEAIDGVERGAHAAEADSTRLRNGGGSVRAHPVDDGMYPTTDNKVSGDRDSLRKVDLESNDTNDAKSVKVYEDEAVQSEDEEPGKIKQFMAKYRKEIRVASHIVFGALMTG